MPIREDNIKMKGEKCKFRFRLVELVVCWCSFVEMMINKQTCIHSRNCFIVLKNPPKWKFIEYLSSSIIESYNQLAYIRKSSVFIVQFRVLKKWDNIYHKVYISQWKKNEKKLEHAVQVHYKSRTEPLTRIQGLGLKKIFFYLYSK